MELQDAMYASLSAIVRRVDRMGANTYQLVSERLKTPLWRIFPLVGRQEKVAGILWQLRWSDALGQLCVGATVGLEIGWFIGLGGS